MKQSYFKKNRQYIETRVKHITRTNARLLLSLITIIFILLVVFLSSFISNKKVKVDTNSSRGNNIIVDSCEQIEDITYSCYKKQLTIITQELGPQTAMKLVRQQYDKSQYVSSMCHQLTHVIGRAAYTKYGDIAKTFVNGDYFCASGYFHGSSEQIITERGTDYMFKNAQKICAPFTNKKDKYKINHYNCVHGIGHGLFESTDGELFEALVGCDKMAEKWEQSSCYSGVFMQNVMQEQVPINGVSKESKYLRATEPMYPCTVVEDKYKSGCYIFQSSYALTKVNYDFSRVFALCAEAEPNYRGVCYGSIGRDVSGLYKLDHNKTAKTCYLGSDFQAQMECINGAAKNTIYSYNSDKQAYDFCSQVTNTFVLPCRQTVLEYFKTFRS